LLILCDSGSSNRGPLRLWKRQLQYQIANLFDVAVAVCHYPSGASKWNPIEHRMFSLISNNWAGQPLHSYETVLNYTATTQPETGFRGRPVLVEKTYKTRVKVSDAEMKALYLFHHPTCSQWNNTIALRPKATSAVP